MEYIIHNIAKYFTTNYKQYIYTNSISNINGTTDIDKHSNHLETLLLLFPEKLWDWFIISKRKDISWEFIKAHPNFPWNIKSLYINPNINLDNIDELNTLFNKPHRPHREFSTNVNVTWEVIQANPTDYDPSFVSENPNITMDIVLANPNYKWDINVMPTNPSITIIDMLVNNDKFSWNWYWDYGYLFLKKYELLTIDLIKKYRNVPLNKLTISWYANITIEDVINNPDIKWVNHWLAQNKNISFQDIMNTPFLREYVSGNPNVTWQNICDNPDIDWEYDYLSCNKNILWEHIHKHSNKSWDWGHISTKKEITLDIIWRHPHINWLWPAMSYNPNITWKFVQDNTDKDWSFYYLSRNPFI